MYIVKDMGYWLDPLNRPLSLAFFIEIALPKCNVLKTILRKDTDLFCKSALHDYTCTSSSFS